MHLQMEAQLLYHKVNHTGKRNVRRYEKEGVEAHLKNLWSLIHEEDVTEEIDLGTLEIPLDKIVGVADGMADREEELLYDAKFFPLAEGNSDFAEQWCDMYLAYLGDRESRTPITCYEYLGKFYVKDGKKRVSILKSHGAHVVRAEVIRVRTKAEGEEAPRYEEFLRDFEKTGLYQLEFTRPDSLKKLQEALGWEEDYVWNDVNRYGFLFHWYLFENAFHEAFRGEMPITTADALLVMLEEFSYQQLKAMEPWILAGLIRDRWEKFYQICYPEFARALERRMKRVS